MVLWWFSCQFSFTCLFVIVHSAAASIHRMRSLIYISSSDRDITRLSQLKRAAHNHYCMDSFPFHISSVARLFHVFHDTIFNRTVTQQATVS